MSCSGCGMGKALETLFTSARSWTSTVTVLPPVQLPEPKATGGDAVAAALGGRGVEGGRRYGRKHKDVEAILVPVPPRGQPPRLVRIGGTTKLETK